MRKASFGEIPDTENIKLAVARFVRVLSAGEAIWRSEPVLSVQQRKPDPFSDVHLGHRGKSVVKKLVSSNSSWSSSQYSTYEIWEENEERKER